MAIVDADVKAVIDTKRDTTPFIVTAQLVVNEVLIDATLSAARKDKIVLYLAAHLVFITESEGLVSAQVGDMHEEYIPRTYGNTTPVSLAMTPYGKIALLLDTSGKLAAMSAPGLKAQFTVLAQDQCLSPNYYLWW